MPFYFTFYTCSVDKYNAIRILKIKFDDNYRIQLNFNLFALLDALHNLALILFLSFSFIVCDTDSVCIKEPWMISKPLKSFNRSILKFHRSSLDSIEAIFSYRISTRNIFSSIVLKFIQHKSSVFCIFPPFEVILTVFFIIAESTRVMIVFDCSLIWNEWMKFKFVLPKGFHPTV